MRSTALILLLIGLLALVAPSDAATPVVYLLKLDGAIGPSVADYIGNGISTAEEHRAQAVIIRMDTPGGSYDAMMKIVQAELASRIPVIVFVPNGARAASAGTFITMAANIAAMGPASNIGSAHPVFNFPTGKSVDDIMMKKVVNDAAAYIASIAEKRGRNAKWGQDAVRIPANITAQQAVKLNVIDFTAESIPEVLSKADGRKVSTSNGEVTLHTRGAGVEEIDMRWTELLLQKLGDPTIAFLLMLVAIFGIMFEINNPGAIAPGIMGGIALVLLLFSFSIIQVSAAGILLILIALGLFIVDLKVPTHGALTAGGIIAFFLGSVMLFAQKPSPYSAPIAVIASGTLAVAVFFIFLVGWGAKALKNPVVTGREGIIGRVVEARTDIDPTGKIFTEGSWWTAYTKGEPIGQGQKARIVDLNGLKIEVVKADDQQREELV